MTMDIASWSPRMLSVLRIMTALLFIEHGTQKFFGFPGPGPALTPLLVVQGILELGGRHPPSDRIPYPARRLHPRPATWRSPIS